MRISLGVIIAIVLIFFWYKHDHPDAVVMPTKVGMARDISCLKTA